MVDSQLDYDTTFEEGQLEKSDHAKGARIVRGIATREGVFRAGDGSPSLVGKRIYRPGSLLQAHAGSLLGKNLYLGVKSHPVEEDDSKASGRITEAYYDPVDKSLKYAAQVDETRVCPDLMKALDRGTILPNSVRSHVNVRWEPGEHPVYGKYDGVETFIDLHHVSQVEAGACPAGSCGIGLHCSYTQEEEEHMPVTPSPFKGDVTIGAIDTMIANAGQMDPEKAASASLGILQAISEQASGKKGMFAEPSHKFPVPVITDHGDLQWGETSDHAEAKGKTEAALQAMAGALKESKTKHAEDKSRLDAYVQKEAEAAEAEKKGIVAALAKTPTFTKPEAQALLLKMPIEDLKVLAADLPQESHHAEDKTSTPKDGRPKFSAQGKGGKDADISNVGLFTDLTPAQHTALRAQFEEKTGRPLIQKRAGVSFGNPDLKPGKEA